MNKAMIKIGFIFFSFGLLLQSAFSETMSAQCSANVVFEGVFIDISCSRGACSGQFPAQDLYVEGICDVADIIFQAQGTTTESYVTGICKAGVFSASIPSQTVGFYGYCGNEEVAYGIFANPLTGPISTGSGYCQENGLSRIFFTGGTRPLTGQCRPY